MTVTPSALNARVRNPISAASVTFAGASLTVATNAEFRFKLDPGQATTVNFPGVGGNAGESGNGGGGGTITGVTANDEAGLASEVTIQGGAGGTRKAGAGGRGAGSCGCGDRSH